MASSPSRTKPRCHGRSMSMSMSMASASSSFASSISTFSSRSSSFFARTAASPPRVRVCGHSTQSSSSSSTSVRFSIDRPASPAPGRSISVIKNGSGSGGSGGRPVSSSQKKTCMCSPTTHPGSFRCALHKKSGPRPAAAGGGGSSGSNYSSGRSLNFRRSAMTNSLVRIGGVEGDLVKRALSALIRPSSNQLRRREDFRPRPSRLSVMSKAEDDL